MIELPRACIRADEIAAEADFFSFGTNDLTQTTLAFSRDDAEGKFLTHYLDDRILDANPFETLDSSGVGDLMRIAVERAHGVKRDLKLGICGEHGGDPKSVAFCHELGLDYVSCSPYRVPLALERDYDIVSKFIDAVVGRSFTIRGWGGTVWVALLGVAIDRESWELALFAVAALAAFGFLDAYHAWLYAEALRYAVALEGLMADHFGRTRGAAEAPTEEQFAGKLGELHFGLFANIPPFRLPYLARARPPWVFWVLYPVLVIIAVAVAALIAVA
jgi:hypothetical protein